MKVKWIRSKHVLFDVTQFVAFYVKESSDGKYWYICAGTPSGKEIHLDYAENEEDAIAGLKTLHCYLVGDKRAPIEFPTLDGFTVVGERDV